MKPTEVAYIAGLMDGEGCFVIFKQKNSLAPNGFAYGIRVEFTMCDRDPIELIGRLFDRPVKSRKLKSGRTAYKVVLHATAAAVFTKRILPHLRGKREQAKLLLTIFDKHLPGRGKMHTEESVAAFEMVKAKLHSLKRPHLLRC